MVQSRDQSLVKKDATTFGGGDGLFVLRFDMFAAEKLGIDGPGSRANHCNSATECGQHDWTPGWQ